MNYRKKNDFLTIQDGFILLESLVSLSLLTFILMFSIPLTVNLISYLEMQRIEVEIDRALYDSSRVWQRRNSFSESHESYNQSLDIIETENAVTVEGNQGAEKRLEVISVSWNE